MSELHSLDTFPGAPDSVALGYGLKIDISNKIPGDTDVVHPETTRWKPHRLEPQGTAQSALI